MKPKIRNILIAVLALVVLTGAAVWMFNRNRPSVPNTAPEEGAAPQEGAAPEEESPLQAQPTPGVEEQHIQELREMLQRTSLSEEARSSVQEKLEMAERLAAQRASARANPALMQGDKDPGPAASFMQMPEQPLEEGIFEGSQGLIRPSVADVANVWQGERSGVVYQVFAGSTVEENPRGLVIVVAMAPDRPAGERQFYTSPDEPARLRIVEVQDQRLLLEDEQGRRSFFSLESRIFEH